MLPEVLFQGVNAAASLALERFSRPPRSTAPASLRGEARDHLRPSDSQCGQRQQDMVAACCRRYAAWHGCRDPAGAPGGACERALARARSAIASTREHPRRSLDSAAAPSSYGAASRVKGKLGRAPVGCLATAPTRTIVPAGPRAICCANHEQRRWPAHILCKCRAAPNKASSDAAPVRAARG